MIGVTGGHGALLDDLRVRAGSLVRPDRRAVLGIAGAPGAGKSTVAFALVEAVLKAGVLGGEESVVHLPMDGFHLADVVRSLLDEAWFVEVPDERRRQRLVERHQRFGKPPEVAFEWVHVVDQRNADLVAQTRQRADLVVVPEY